MTELEVRVCPICAGEIFIPFLLCRDYTISLESFNLIKCETCKFVITSPRPALLDKYYLSDSYVSHAKSAKNIIDAIYMVARNFTLRWKLSLVNQATDKNIKSKSILDYGCGTGEFLKASKTKGWNITGIEPSLYARQQAPGKIAADIMPSLDFLSEKEKFNAITLWHVLEHIPDPSSILQKLKNRLALNGHLFIAVPNHTSWDACHYRQAWAGYDVPRHLWHFSKKNMKMLIESNQLKLANIIPMKLDAFYISLLSEKYLRGGGLGFSKIITASISGLRSNYYARANNEYSSLIYVVRK